MHVKALNDCRILLVDDTKANLDVLVAGLKSDYKLNVALSGEAALQLVERIQPDLILLDINMPGIDGYEVCRRLRTQSVTAEIPIVFVSALNEVTDKTRGFELGATDYITKPFDLLEVQARVRSLLKAKAYNDAAKEQMAGELRVARDIQRGMLPRDFAPIQQQFGLRMAARLLTAGEVGGDLYAAFAPDPDRLVVIMGDVSGKGIPAALFMVRTLSMVQLLARDLDRPEQILARLNDELAADNPSTMFVTLLCASYEPHTGRLCMASAGQTSPVLLRSGQPPRLLLPSLGTALGLEPNLVFEGRVEILQPGDTLLLYTDGVTEAFNSAAECYSTPRLLMDLATVAVCPPDDLTDALVHRVQSFAGSAPQSDDIALLALQVTNASRSAPQADVAREGGQFQCSPNGVMAAVDAFRAFALAARLSASDIFAVSLALEECASNILHHAWGGHPEGSFHLDIQLAEDAISCLLSDSGRPMSRPLDNLQADAERGGAGECGGWGLHLARSFVDTLEYKRERGRNFWRLTKKLEASATVDCVEFTH